jgi:hypothetical protein
MQAVDKQPFVVFPVKHYHQDKPTFAHRPNMLVRVARLPTIPRDGLEALGVCWDAKCLYKSEWWELVQVYDEAHGWLSKPMDGVYSFKCHNPGCKQYDIEKFWAFRARTKGTGRERYLVRFKRFPHLADRDLPQAAVKTVL